jgi:four helix bundle protein
MGARHFRELIVWQLADELRREVYLLIDSSNAARDFEFRNQLRRAVAGIAANLADGFRRGSAVDFARLVAYSACSLDETENWLIDGIARGHWDDQGLVDARRLIRRLTPAIRRLQRYLLSSTAATRSRGYRTTTSFRAPRKRS